MSTLHTFLRPSVSHPGTKCRTTHRAQRVGLRCPPFGDQDEGGEGYCHNREQKPQTLGLQSKAPQCGAADAEIKVPSSENSELKRSPFKAMSRSVHSYTCYAYCQGFLSYLFLHFRSIHLHFFQNLSQFFPVLAVANTLILCRPTEWNRSRCWMQVPVLSARGI